VDPATLHDISEGIERLLTEVRAVAGPVAWPRVEQLLSSVVQLYGAGLARVLESVDDTVRARLSEDELFESIPVYETRDYVRRVLLYAESYRELYPEETGAGKPEAVTSKQ